MKKLFLLFFVLTILSSCGNRKSTAEQKYDKFIIEYNEIKSIIKPYQQQQLNIEYTMGKGTQSSSPEKYAETINFLIGLLGENPCRTNDYEACEDALRKLLKSKQSSLAWYLIAVIELKRGVTNEQSINKALALDPDFGEYYRERAVIYTHQSKYQLAAIDYRMALKLYSDSVRIYDQLLSLYRTSKNEIGLFATHRVVIQALQDSVNHQSSQQKDALHSQILKQNLSLAYMNEVFDFLNYNHPDSAKIAIQKAEKLGYTLSKDDKQQLGNLLK